VFNNKLTTAAADCDGDGVDVGVTVVVGVTPIANQVNENDSPEVDPSVKTIKYDRPGPRKPGVDVRIETVTRGLCK
jgi:hypothetical protein